MAWEARSPHDGRAKHRMWAALPLCAVRAGLATRFLRRELARGAPSVGDGRADANARCKDDAVRST